MSTKYVTRREGVRLVNDKLGIPLSMSTVEKDACLGVGPTPAATYGPKHLYTPEEFLRYAQARIVKLTPAGDTVEA
jgi:hypothetical protein